MSFESVTKEVGRKSLLNMDFSNNQIYSEEETFKLKFVGFNYVKVVNFRNNPIGKPFVNTGDLSWHTVYLDFSNTNITILADVGKVFNDYPNLMYLQLVIFIGDFLLFYRHLDLSNNIVAKATYDSAYLEANYQTVSYYLEYHFSCPTLHSKLSGMQNNYVT